MKASVTTLIDKMSAAQDDAKAGAIADLLETNGVGNFRADFMRTFMALTRFMMIFIASAAWSTEMWYRSEGYDSLMAEPADRQQVG